MKKFKFSLQVLLNVRKNEEKGLTGELYRARKRLALLNEQLDNMKQTGEAEQKNFKEIMLQGITAERMQNYNSYFIKLSADIKNQIKKVEECERECKNILSKLVEVKKTIKTLEILKEKKYHEYLKQEQIEESKTIDDFINSRSGRVTEVM